MRPDANPDVDRVVYERTEEEVREGKATGPHTEAEVDALLGKIWAPARRCGLMQPAGVRPIDDFSEYHHNDASETWEKIDLGGVDTAASLAREWYVAVAADGSIKVALDDGSVLQGVRHPEYGGKKKLRLLGRALDLRRAFKQLSIQKSQRPFAVVTILHPVVMAVRYYVLQAVPFGARNAVYIFGNMGRSFDMVLTNMFAFVVAQYVDDFPQLELSQLTEGVQPETVFDLLGWEVKKSDGGCIPTFGPAFGALGEVFLLETWHLGDFFVANKTERAKRVAALVEQVIKEDAQRTTTVEALRGLLAFARSQCFGRGGSYAANVLSRLSSGVLKGVTAEVASHLRFWPTYLEKSKPRRVAMTQEKGHDVFLCSWTVLKKTMA